MKGDETTCENYDFTTGGLSGYCGWRWLRHIYEGTRKTTPKAIETMETTVGDYESNWRRRTRTRWTTTTKINEAKDETNDCWRLRKRLMATDDEGGLRRREPIIVYHRFCYNKNLLVHLINRSSEERRFGRFWRVKMIKSWMYFGRSKAKCWELVSVMLTLAWGQRMT